MERLRRENGQQQMDTPEKAEGNWGDNGRDGLTHELCPALKAEGLALSGMFG